MDEAEKVKALPGRVMPGGWLRFDGTRLAEERGTCFATLGETSQAAEELTEALNTTTSLRRRGSILTDLALLGIKTHDLDATLDYGGQATDLAELTRSSGYVGRRLHTLRSALKPMLTDRRAAQLNGRLAHI